MSLPAPSPVSSSRGRDYFIASSNLLRESSIRVGSDDCKLLTRWKRQENMVVTDVWLGGKEVIHLQTAAPASVDDSVLRLCIEVQHDSAERMAHARFGDRGQR